MVLWDRREPLVKQVFEAVVVCLHKEATPPQVRPPVVYYVDEADELPLVCGESAVVRCERSAEESNGMPLLDEDSSKAMGRCVALHRKGLGEVQNARTGADVTAALRVLV